MNSILLKFYYKLAIFSTIVTLIAILLYNTVLKSYYVSQFPITLIVFILITGGIFYILWRDDKKEKGKFNQLFLMGTTVKILVLLTFLAIILIIDRKNAVPFLISFLVLYFLFTIFEVVSILSFVKSKKKEQSTEN